MFDLFLSNDGNGFPNGDDKLQVDYENSIYVGDALGRKNDWSDCDLLFAQNCGLKYMSPEMFFTGKEEEERKCDNITDFRKPDINDINMNMNMTELIIMVGYPASGKTTYVNNYKDIFDKNGVEKYYVLHGDVLKTESKMKKRIKEGLNMGKSIVIDATNPSIKKRKTLIRCAYDINPDIFVKIIHIEDDIDVCMERNCCPKDCVLHV